MKDHIWKVGDLFVVSDGPHPTIFEIDKLEGDTVYSFYKKKNGEKVYQNPDKISVMIKPSRRQIDNWNL